MIKLSFTAHKPIKIVYQRYLKKIRKVLPLATKVPPTYKFKHNFIHQQNSLAGFQTQTFTAELYNTPAWVLCHGAAMAVVFS